MRRGALAAVLALFVGGAAGAGCEPACEGPYRSAGGDERPLGGPVTGTWPATGTPRPPVVMPLDTDGDGAEDGAEISEDRRTLTLHRTSGDLVLTVPEPALIWTDLPQLMPAGDLDGDGRADLQLRVWARPPEHASDQPPATTYLVGGATPDGTHALAAVGSTPFADPANDGPTATPAGDVDGDGRDDLVLASPLVSDLPVWFGADLPLTPGSTAPVPPSLHAPAGTLVGAVRLHGREALVIVTRATAPEQPSHDLQLWVPEGGLPFTTAGEGPDATVLPVGIGHGPGHAAIVDDGDDSWLTLSLENRSLRQRWAWDLDDWCAATPPAGAVAGSGVGPGAVEEVAAGV